MRESGPAEARGALGGKIAPTVIAAMLVISGCSNESDELLSLRLNDLQKEVGDECDTFEGASKEDIEEVLERDVPFLVHETLQSFDKLYGSVEEAGSVTSEDRKFRVEVATNVGASNEVNRLIFMKEARFAPTEPGGQRKIISVFDNSGEIHVTYHGIQDETNAFRVIFDSQGRSVVLQRYIPYGIDQMVDGSTIAWSRDEPYGSFQKAGFNYENDYENTDAAACILLGMIDEMAQFIIDLKKYTDQ